MRALVTGAAGFVGKHLMRHLLASGDDVLGVGRVSAGEREACPELLSSERFYELDITDRAAVERVLAKFRPSTVYHLAGISFVPSCEENYSEALRVNVAGTETVLRCFSEQAFDGKFLFVSSGDVFGSKRQDELPLTERTEVRPRNLYAVSKLAAEQSVWMHARRSSVTCSVARPFNHIGPGQDERFAASAFAKQIAQVLQQKRTLPLKVGNLSAERDFSDVRDIVRAYRLIAEQGEGLYLIGSGQLVTVEQLLRKMLEVAGLEFNVETEERLLRTHEGARDVAPVGDFGKVRELGWKPRYSLGDSVSALLEWWQRRSEG